MPASPSDAVAALEALSPVDGRYVRAAAPLRALLSEAALIRERVRVEAQWLLHLAAAVPQLPGAALSGAGGRRAQPPRGAPGPALKRGVGPPAEAPPRRPGPGSCPRRQGHRGAHQPRRQGGGVLRARAA